MKAESNAARWLLLIHQIPPTPPYFRVKTGRRLSKLGAVAIKNSVYVLPRSDVAREDFEWVRREIVEGGGDASVCEARFVDGLLDPQIEALFNVARDAEYAEVAKDAREIEKAVGRKKTLTADARGVLERGVARLHRRVAEIAAIDHCGASGRVAADARIATLEELLADSVRHVASNRADVPSYRGRTWVTRQGVHVDRIASAWLIRRFVDTDATFAFVGKGDRVPVGALRFDMYDAEFTHEGDACTFEVLADRFRLAAPALTSIARIVHDLDIKDDRFRLPETAGTLAQLNGICWRYAADADRLRAGQELFDTLFEFFKRRRR